MNDLMNAPNNEMNMFLSSVNNLGQSIVPDNRVFGEKIFLEPCHCV